MKERGGAGPPTRVSRARRRGSASVSLCIYFGHRVLDKRQCVSVFSLVSSGLDIDKKASL